MPGPGLLLIAHGSRDPRHARAMAALAAAVRETRIAAAVEVGFLGLCGPSVAEAYGRLLTRSAVDAAEAEVEDGQQDRMLRVVPLFLKAGYHVQQDVPQALAVARRAFPARIGLSVAPALGPDRLLSEAFERRIREAGCWPEDPELEVMTAGATKATELDPAVLAAPQRPGIRRRIVLAQFLAPGQLPDRARERAAAAGVPITEPLITDELGPAPELIRLVGARYLACGATTSASCAASPSTTKGSLIPSG
jgi:sirohydrochlorin ferrochelatase